MSCWLTFVVKIKAMDPIKKIEAAEAKRAKLREQLQMPGIGEQEDHEIRTEICAITKEITALYALLPMVDNRSYWNRIKDEYYAAPMMWNIACLSTSWLGVRYYSIARHKFAPYTAQQLIWRRWALFFDASDTPGMKKVSAASTFLAVTKGWTRQDPPTSWSPYRARHE